MTSKLEGEILDAVTRITDELDELDHGSASLQQACVGGISLMELLVGYRRALIVDAIIDPEGAPGNVWRKPLSEVETRVASHLDSTHDAPLPAAIEAGRAMGADLPSDIEVVGIVIERGDVFGEELSDVVAGDELTLDYLINNEGGDSWPCHCGAARCRGETGHSFFTLPEALQCEYAPLLAPWFREAHAGKLAHLA